MRTRLKTAGTWMYQLQELYEPENVLRLAESRYPLLVVEPGHNFREYPYDTGKMVTRLRRMPSGEERILLAYIDIGQAEDYRDYWKKSWVAPTVSERGSPSFLITIDPDGWSGNYPVAYWDRQWKQLWTGPEGIVNRLAGLGFDGIYLDWVEAYDDESVMAVAEEQAVDAAAEMIRFIEELGRAGRKMRPGFLVVPQNAPFLLDRDAERYAAAIDALAVEDTWFHGEGDAEWDDPGAGDLTLRHEDRWSTPSRLGQYRKYQELGLPVFSVDYCRSPQNAAIVYREARQNGLIPLVTRVSLSRMTETPPW